MKGWTADPETGTVPLLLQAYDRNVSDLDQMWESVDEYRDQVRAIQAQGIVGLELIIDHWDSETGEYVAPLRAALDDGLDTVVDMYSVGVRPTGPDGQSFVQLRDNIAISSRLTQNAIPEKDKWLWNTTSNKQDTIMTKEFLEPYLKEMLDNYRPENHDDMTLEEYLVSKDVPTSFQYRDTCRVHKTRGSGTLTRDVQYQIQVTIGHIEDNSYRTSNLRVGDSRCAYQERWARSGAGA